jgi:hypothetical protein
MIALLGALAIDGVWLPYPERSFPHHEIKEKNGRENFDWSKAYN